MVRTDTPNAPNNSGDTPIKLALKHGHTEIVEALEARARKLQNHLETSFVNSKNIIDGKRRRAK